MGTAHRIVDLGKIILQIKASWFLQWLLFIHTVETLRSLAKVGCH